MKSSFLAVAAALLLAAGLHPAAAATGQNQLQDQIKRGHALLQRDCARCHAIGRTGASPRRDAPAFRSLGRRSRYAGIRI